MCVFVLEYYTLCRKDFFSVKKFVFLVSGKSRHINTFDLYKNRFILNESERKKNIICRNNITCGCGVSCARKTALAICITRATILKSLRGKCLLEWKAAGSIKSQYKNRQNVVHKKQNKTRKMFRWETISGVS